MKPFLLFSFLFIVATGFTTIENFSALTANNKTNKKKDVVRVYQNPGCDGSISVYSTTHQTLELYLFDLDGKMIHQLTLKNKEKQTINGLKKGTYMYNILNRDETIEGGKIIIRK